MYIELFCMAQASNLIQEIENSSDTDWNRWETSWSNLNNSQNHGLMAVYEPDVNLRLEKGEILQQGYLSNWSDKYANSASNESYELWVMYGNSPIDVHTFVSVDSHMAQIPIPDASQNPPEISQYENTLGRVISHDVSVYQQKRKQANIKVV